MWYDNLVENQFGWTSYTWANWKELFTSTFQSNRIAYEINIVNHRPKPGDSLYEFHFEHLAKIK